jgi:hypothetical protein
MFHRSIEYVHDADICGATILSGTLAGICLLRACGTFFLQDTNIKTSAVSQRADGRCEVRQSSSDVTIGSAVLERS